MNADTLILLTLALVALVIIGLFVSIWRIIAGRRALQHAGQLLAAKDEELQFVQAQHLELREANHQQELTLTAQQGQCDNLAERLADKQSDLDALKAEFAELQARLNRREQDYARLETEKRERQDRHEEQLGMLNEARDNLKKEFENLANKIFEDKGKSFTATSRASLEDMLKPFREQISGFRDRIDKVHTESVKGQTQLESELKKVLDIGLEMNSQASNLASALKGDKKTTGNWGEAQLERTLELAGLLPGEHYETQAAFRDEEGKRRLPDFIIKLPDGKSLVVDSKVSLVDYDRAIAADTEEERDKALAAHATAVRNHIDDLAHKDYANLPGLGSPDFVLMFMPVEPAYIEAMKHNKELFNAGYQKGVIMVSHTTLMPILRTVANLWMIDKSNKEAREISASAGDLYNQVARVAERISRLGSTLNTAQGHYNDAVKSLVGRQGLVGKVDRFQQVSQKANKKMPKLEELGGDFEADRLESMTGESESAPKLVDDSDKVKPLKSDKQP
ncbi:MAG: DNA recombination protein RmuC [Halioglobus sp.]|nr:DNA recombination protein RmuC [Halioglobus sp.]